MSRRHHWSSGRSQRYPSYEKMAKALKRRHIEYDRAKRLREPEPGIKAVSCPLPHGAKIVNTWAEMTSPILGLPYVTYELAIEGFPRPMPWRRFRVPIQSFE